MSKITPLGGKHQTVHSMLAEMMGNPEIRRAVVFGFDDNGNCEFCHLGVTRKEMAYVGAIALQHSVEEES